MTRRPLGSGDFEQARGAHAAADAHRDHDVFYLAPPSLDQRVTDHASAGHPVRMADGDRAAVHVQPLHRNAELVAAIDDLDGKRLVELPQADVVHLETVALEKLRHGEDRPDAHLVWLTAADDQTSIDSKRLDVALLCKLGVHEHACGCAVRQLARVARSDEPAL